MRAEYDFNYYTEHSFVYQKNLKKTWQAQPTLEPSFRPKFIKMEFHRRLPVGMSGTDSNWKMLLYTDSYQQLSVQQVTFCIKRFVEVEIVIGWTTLIKCFDPYLWNFFPITFALAGAAAVKGMSMLPL